MRKLTVIGGGRDPKLVRATNQIRGLIQQGATIRIEPAVLTALTRLGLRLTQLKTMLGRCRVDEFEPNAQGRPEISIVFGTILEEFEDDRIVREFALKVVVEQPVAPGRLAVIDIGQLVERK